MKKKIEKISIQSMTLKCLAQIVPLFSFFTIVQKWYILGKCSQSVPLFQLFFSKTGTLWGDALYLTPHTESTNFEGGDRINPILIPEKQGWAPGSPVTVENWGGFPVQAGGGSSSGFSRFNRKICGRFWSVTPVTKT